MIYNFVCIRTGAYRVPMRAAHPLKPELLVVVSYLSWVLGTRDLLEKLVPAPTDKSFYTLTCIFIHIFRYL